MISCHLEKVKEPKVAIYEPFKCGICDHSTETLGNEMAKPKTIPTGYRYHVKLLELNRYPIPKFKTVLGRRRRFLPTAPAPRLGFNLDRKKNCTVPVQNETLKLSSVHIYTNLIDASKYLYSEPELHQIDFFATLVKKI
jgi:hypothetical protein